jgi:hypothetical protein
MVSEIELKRRMTVAAPEPERDDAGPPERRGPQKRSGPPKKGTGPFCGGVSSRAVINEFSQALPLPSHESVTRMSVMLDDLESEFSKFFEGELGAAE